MLREKTCSLSPSNAVPECMTGLFQRNFVSIVICCAFFFSLTKILSVLYLVSYSSKDPISVIYYIILKYYFLILFLSNQLYKFYFFLYTNYTSVGSWLDIVVGVIRHDVGMMLKNLFWPYLLMIQIQLIFVYLYVGIENLPLVVRDKIGSFRFHIHNIFWNRFKRFSQWYEFSVSLL